MSTRRIDDPGSFDGDAIGALVAQLPGATRLSHVLTAGAKHLEAQQQLQQRKSADVAGYARSGKAAYDPNDTRQYNYIPSQFHVGNLHLRVLINNYQREVNQLMRGVGYEGNAIEALDQIKKNIWSVSDLDYLREHDAYVALAYIYKQNPSSYYGKHAKLLLREALHSDQDNAAGERAKVVELIQRTKKFFGGDVAKVDPSKPDWAKLGDAELLQLDQVIRGVVLPTTQTEMDEAKRAREQEDREAMEANMEWADANLERQANKRAARGDSGTYSVDHDPDGEDPESQPQWNF